MRSCFLTINAVNKSICSQIVDLQRIHGVNFILVTVSIAQLSLYQLGSDQQQTQICRRIVVRIGDDCGNQVCAHLYGVSHFLILEGQGRIAWQATNKVDYPIQQISGNSLFFHRISVRIQLGDKLLRSDTARIGTGEILSKNGIKPSGECHINTTHDCFHANLTEGAVSGNCRSNNRSIGSHIGIDRTSMNQLLYIKSVAIIDVQTVFYDYFGFGRFNHHCANSGTDSYQTIQLVADFIGSGYGINARMDRCLCGSVGLTIGLHTGIVDMQAGMICDHLTVHSDLHSHFVTLIIKDKVAIVILIAALIYKDNLGRVGNDHKCTGNGLCIVQAIAHIQHKGHLGVKAVIQHILGIVIAGNTQYNDLAVVVNTHIQVLDRVDRISNQIALNIVGFCI